jgi:predicted RNase H-like HicB family nuclease
MLTTYIRAAMERAEYSIIDDGVHYAEIPDLPGVWGEGDTRAAAEQDLREVLEGWIVLRFQHHLPIPAISGHSLQLVEVN